MSTAPNRSIRTFTQDQKELIAAEAKSLAQTAYQLYKWVEEDELSEDMAKKLPSLLESKFVNLAKYLDYESQLADEQQKRYVEIRQANETIQKLQAQLAAQQPIDGMQDKLKQLHQLVYQWWSQDGFHYLSESGFTETGMMNVTFGFMLNSRNSRLFSQTPSTDRIELADHIQHLKTLEFQFLEEGGYGENELIDNAKNRELLHGMLTTRFPSLVIEQFQNRATKVPLVFTIHRVKAYIHDIRDIERQ